MNRGFIVTIIWGSFIFLSLCFKFNGYNSSDRWWVNAKDGGEKTFIRAGLWQVCF